MIKVDSLERKLFDKTGIFPFAFIKANTRKNETIIFDHSTDFMDHLTKILPTVEEQMCGSTSRFDELLVKALVIIFHFHGIEGPEQRIVWKSRPKRLGNNGYALPPL